MDYFKQFSTDYANGVSAIAACLTLALAALTLLFLLREYRHKYRPYVMPDVSVEPLTDSKAYAVSLIPRNVGPHPCEVKLTNIRLIIGDETYETPDMKEWVLIAPQIMEMRMPIGHVNENGIQRVREGRYRANRIEVTFTLGSQAVDGRFLSAADFIYDINVLGDSPVVQFRPEWRKRA